MHMSCRVIQHREADIYTVLHFGADPSGQKDSSKAFEEALDKSPYKVIVPPGRYLIENTVEVNRKHLFLEAGVTIENNDRIQMNSPLFWIHGIHSIIEGENKSVKIKSNSISATSVIKIGHDDARDVRRNILYCEVKNLTIEGSGRGTKLSGIHFYNSQEKGDEMTTSYFHSIHNLIIQRVNIGIHMERFSNGNSISNIIFNRVGAPESGCAIWFDGATENRVYDFFHHHSANALSVKFTRNKDKTPSYNILQAGICEQGGDDARCVEMEAGAHNIIDINCNVLKGNMLPKDFQKRKNIILTKPRN
ncbi:MAG: glycoside hydrolase family 55 protein [Bacteroidia bacterium]|nr:glycoside hydrolase family 55 protein [Bacteroidia bacterium]